MSRARILPRAVSPTTPARPRGDYRRPQGDWGVDFREPIVGKPSSSTTEEGVLRTWPRSSRPRKGFSEWYVDLVQKKLADY